MTWTHFINGFGTVLLFLFFIFLGFMYLRNILKLYRALSIEDYNLITVLRVIGAFTFIGGVVMGFV